MTGEAKPDTTACPDFESLSCYADGELDPPAAAAMAAHVADCARCGGMAVRLLEGFEADHVGQGGGMGGSECAGEERLVAYAAGGLETAERARVTDHLITCDACIGALAVVHRRLGIASMVDTPVPTRIQARARLALETGMRELAAANGQMRPVAPRAPALLDRVRALFRAPVLVPAALAAGALVMVALQQGRIDPAGSGERSRAVAPDSTTLRVTAVEATVRSRPSMQSQIVATVRRGALVQIAGEERDWYEVRVDGGQPGWVEREAFE
jgi:anti-sigma factor RsiW